MRIQLAVLDTDTTYLTRLQDHLAAGYPGRIEVLAFTSLEGALASVAETRTHVLVAAESFDVDPESLPPRTVLARLVDSPEVESVRGVPAIPRYAPVDAFYRSVVALFDEVAASVQMRTVRTGDAGHLVVVTSPAGGVGTTSTAIATARSLSMQTEGSRTLFLSLDPCEDVSARFGLTDPTHGTFSDVVYAVKRRRGNLQLQLEQHAYRDAFGTLFFASAPLATDVLELADDDVALLTEHLGAGGFDTAVIDVPFALDARTLKLLDAASQIVLVTDGSPEANAKVVRALGALEVLSAQHELSLLPRTGLLYNRWDAGSVRLEDLPVTEIGGITRFEGGDDEHVVNAIYASGSLDRVVQAVAR